MTDIRLGDKVRDRVSGFEGIALATMIQKYGVTRWRVHPDRLDQGNLPSEEWFDEGQLERVEKPKPMMGFGATEAVQ